MTVTSAITVPFIHKPQLWMQILNLRTTMKGTTCSIKIIISKLIAKVDKIGQKLCKASNFQGTCTTCCPYFDFFVFLLSLTPHQPDTSSDLVFVFFKLCTCICLEISKLVYKIKVFAVFTSSTIDHC